MNDTAANPTRLKRSLLRAAVQENVNQVQGVVPQRLPAGSWRARAIWLGALGGLAVVAAAVALGRGLLASSSAAVPAEAHRARLAPAPPDHLPAPTAIDAAVFPLAVRKIVVDAGHGGDNRGTVSAHGLVEKDVTLDIALRLERLLQGGGFDVEMTRRTDVAVPLRQRSEIANRAQADAFLSIHINWITTRNSRAVETYYLGPTEDPELRRLAAAENKESGYSFSDFKRLLEGVYAGVRLGESKRFAGELDGELFRRLKVVNPALEDRGVKTAPFVVLVTTEMPAVLAEVSCLSNDREAELLADPEYRQRIAQALYAGVRGFAAQRAPLPAPPGTPAATLAEQPVSAKGIASP